MANSITIPINGNLHASWPNNKRTSLEKLSRRLVAIFILSPQWEHRRLDLTVSAALNSSELLFWYHSDAQWSKPGFFVEQVYQEVHGKLALALGSGVKTVIPAFYVVVSSNRLHIDGPTGWRPGVAFYPCTRYVVHKLQESCCVGGLLEVLELQSDVCFGEER